MYALAPSHCKILLEKFVQKHLDRPRYRLCIYDGLIVGQRLIRR